MKKEQQIKNKLLISTIQNNANQNQDKQSLDCQVETCSPNQPYAAQYYVSPKFEKPEISMTVRGAECASDSDSDWSKTHWKTLMYYYIY